MRKKLISIDFDGVLNSYVSGWTGAADPVPGAMKFLADLVADDRFDAVVYSSRCASEAGVSAIRAWLDRHLVAELGEHAGRYVGNRVRVAASKPPAFVSLDDRVITFDGTWPSLDRIDAFVPWNKKPAETTIEISSRLFKDFMRMAVEGEHYTLPDGVSLEEASENMVVTRASLFQVPTVLVEKVALKIAESNNGGSWSSHYNDDQKNVWRSRSQEIIEMVLADSVRAYQMPDHAAAPIGDEVAA